MELTRQRFRPTKSSDGPLKPCQPFVTYQAFPKFLAGCSEPCQRRVELYLSPTHYLQKSLVINVDHTLVGARALEGRQQQGRDF